jgi:hypothetical protein
LGPTAGLNLTEVFRKKFGDATYELKQKEGNIQRKETKANEEK